MAKHYVEQVVGRRIAAAGTSIMSVRVPVGGTLEKMTVYVNGNVASTNTFDAHLNGTTVFSNQAHRPSITSGNQSAINGGTLAQAVVAGDLLTVDADTVNESMQFVTVVFQIEEGVAAAGWDGGAPSNPTLSNHFYCEDFIGGPAGSNASGTAGFWQANSAAQIDSILNHNGIYRVTSNSASYSHLTMRAAQSNPSIWGNSNFDVNFIVRFNTLTNTNITVGLLKTASSLTDEQICIEKLAADSDFFGSVRTSSGSAASRTAALLTPVAGTWYRFRMRRTASNIIAFSVNGGAELTVTSTYPNQNVQPIVRINATDGASKTVDLDYFDLTLTGLTRY